MDEKFRSRGIWIALGALALIFLCVALVGAGVIAAFVPHRMVGYSAAPQVQAPPAGESSPAPAPAYGYPVRGWYPGWGPFSIVGFGIGLVVRLLVSLLLLLLFFRLVRRILWGPRHWGYRAWGPYCRGGTPQGKEGQAAPDAGPGPWGWHPHRHWGPPPWWGQEPEKGSGADRPDTAETGYTGPQE